MRFRTLVRAVPLAIALGLAVTGSAWAELINLQFTASITSVEGETDPALRAQHAMTRCAWLRGCRKPAAGD
jgi:hypothetical protein